MRLNPIRRDAKVDNASLLHPLLNRFNGQPVVTKSTRGWKGQLLPCRIFPLARATTLRIYDFF